MKQKNWSFFFTFLFLDIKGILGLLNCAALPRWSQESVCKVWRWVLCGDMLFFSLLLNSTQATIKIQRSLAPAKMRADNFVLVWMWRMWAIRHSRHPDKAWLCLFLLLWCHTKKKPGRRGTEAGCRCEDVVSVLPLKSSVLFVERLYRFSQQPPLHIMVDGGRPGAVCLWSLAIAVAMSWKSAFIGCRRRWHLPATHTQLARYAFFFVVTDVQSKKVWPLVAIFLPGWTWTMWARNSPCCPLAVLWMDLFYPHIYVNCSKLHWDQLRAGWVGGSVVSGAHMLCLCVGSHRLASRFCWG